MDNVEHEVGELAVENHRYTKVLRDLHLLAIHGHAKGRCVIGGRT